MGYYFNPFTGETMRVFSREELEESLDGSLNLLKTIHHYFTDDDANLSEETLDEIREFIDKYNR